MDTKKEKTGWFARLKNGLSKSRINLIGIFSGGVVDDEFMEELEFQLISSDVGVETSAKIISQLKDQIKLKGLKTQDEVKTALRDVIEERLKICEKAPDLETHHPTVWMMCGVNGAGKTTSIGKLAKFFANERKTVLLAAGDTFRAAAREQLEIWGDRNQIEVIAQEKGDPASVAFDAITSGKRRGTDVVMVDTAGRLPTQTNLMNELSRIKRVQGKAMEGAPHEVILVLDGTNGQNALMQAKSFDDVAGLTGLIITKLDGTAKGGVLLALADMRKEPLPIYFIGVGEKIDDLQPFNARQFANALVGLEE
ncbi:signal recognition particle-docking protein FtsY [Turicimonas muris]|uniref:Signal recognition particle receptor FtsY n=5 Tax=Turicimonas muris TaxID=1796652 RepID=A0A227KI54_9BURK|nr:signal recognition particle-docking protein FtsY [Turicimonas muris]ANU66632.1 signal recognition particle-docking protein FtsY [Burkholderiales bacterium YL45]OXE47279.1 signal recognition particle-docking protein FtsY [Turicimonas muris]QQQ97781.1 signal recognition particle-docking protein FtsY [Turicimonas muris]